MMRKVSRQGLVPVQVVAVVLLALAWALGCDRQDNDWSLYDPALKLVHIPLDTLRLAETGGEAAFAVTIGMVPADTVFLYPASADSQVRFRPDSIFFAPVDDDWLPPRVVAVQAVQDDLDEGPHGELISFTVRSGDPAFDGQAFDVFIPVTIADDDRAGVAVSESLLTLVESDQGAVFEHYRLALESRPTAPVTVTATVTPGEPSLHLEPVSLTFLPDQWDQEQEISLWIELDGVDHDYQSLVIGHAADSADSNYQGQLAIPSVRLEIFDDTQTPVATVAAVTAGDTIAEAAGGYQVAVTLSRPSVVPVTVRLATVDGSARGGLDFAALDQDVTFLPGDPLTRTFTVAIGDDTVLEATESFQVVITAVEAVVIGAEDRVAVFIADDDVVTLTLTAQNAAEDAGAASFTVAMPTAAEFPVGFTLTTADGTALAGSDYQAVAESFVLEPGETARVVPVVLLADNLHEPDETFTGTLGALSANAVWNGVPATCTIVNDDPQNAVLGDITRHETDGTAVFTVEILRPYPHAVTLTASTRDGDGLGAADDQVDALAGSDFTGAVNAAWTIPAGATSSTFTVPLSNDRQAEAAAEYFRLEITAGSEPGFAGLTARCTLLDDHQPCVQAADVTVGEAAGTALFTLRLLDEAGLPTTSSADVSLQVATVDQTATGGADYGAVAAVFTIPAGQASLDIPVTVNDDPHDDDNETFLLLLTQPVNALGNCADEPAFGTIIDNEFPSINIQSARRRLNEGSVFSFNIALTTPRQAATTFDLNLLAGTSGGPGVDYTFSQNGTHTIPPYTDFITFTVPFLDDQLAAESDEVVEVTIANANCALGVVSLEATIVDAPELSITGDDVLEGETAVFTVTADAASTADQRFYVQHSSGTAISGIDFSTAATGPFTIAAGQTTCQVPVVTVAGDGGDNAVEEFYVTLINPANATNSPFNSAVGTITDGDPPALAWAGTASAGEGDPVIFTVSLSWLSTANVQFRVTFTDGTAARLGIDYDDAATGPFTVPPGNLFYQVAVPTTSDGLPELSAENFTITLHSPVNATVGTPAFTTGYVLDGDQPELSFQLDQSATEGDLLTFTVQLSHATTVPVTFNIEHDNGSTQGAGDFDAGNTGPFTIGVGATTATVTVNTVEDTELEGVETFIIRVADPVNAVLGAGFEAGGTIVDDD